MSWKARPWWLVVPACALAAAGCSVRSAASDLYPDLVEHEGTRVDDVRFIDTDPFHPDTLLTIIDTQPSRCSFLGLPICVPFTRIGRQEFFLNLDRLHADRERIEQFYRIAGYFGTRVTPDAEPDGDNVDVTFTIARGDPIVLDRLDVAGTEGILDQDSLARTLPLRPGDIFNLGQYLASSDAILRALQRRGHMHAEILRSFMVDTVDNRAEAELFASPGPGVTVDSIIVRGAGHLGRRNTIRQLEFNPGDPLRASDLVQSQRNLFGLEIVSLASVTMAPDSLQRAPADSGTATVQVSVVEAPIHELEVAVGFGTVECLRTDVRYVNRSFTGGARRLALRAAVSRLGVGEPFAVGAGSAVCPTAPGDTLHGGDLFDYRLSAEFTQPFFLSRRNQLTLNVFGERLAEPGVYQRQAVGARTGVARRMGLGSTVGVGLDGEYGSTRASPALFCASLLVCDPAIIESLAASRFRVEAGVSYFYDRTDNRLNPTSGRVLRSAAAWASPWLGSDIRFFRWTGDAAYYRPVGDRRVAAFALRIGNFFRTASLDAQGSFLPPEERFYAGGATSVRGFARNELGPGVYVTDTVVVNEAGVAEPANGATFVPTGGTSVVITSAELRMPSPFFSDVLRLAVFVDGGAVGTGALWDLGTLDMKFTPGLGVRLQTPVGPVRLDVAYNPYDRVAGPLLVADLEGGTVRRVAEAYQPGGRTFLNRLQFHLGIGHAF